MVSYLRVQLVLSARLGRTLTVKGTCAMKSEPGLHISVSAHRSHRADAFTLVELLVVVAVIAMLVAILLPALHSTRHSAQSVKSLGNMRQIAVGWMVYANESDNMIVPGQPGRYPQNEKNLYDVGNGRHYRPRWFALMGSKAGFFAYNNPSTDIADEHRYPVDNEIFRCPVVPEWISTRNFPYGYNYQFLGNARFLNDDPAAGKFVNFPVRVHEIQNFTGTVMFASCMGTAAGKPEKLRTPNRPDGSRDPALCAMGGHGYALDPPRLIPEGDFADPQNPGMQHRSAPDPRYAGGKANVVFCDGHCDPMTLEEMGYVVDDDGSVAGTHEDATNQLFSGDSTDKDVPKVNR